jgi:uncharacterized protein with PQ loop repeat
MRHHHALHKKKQKDALDYVVYFFMVATPLFELPQSIAIYSTHNASGVAIWTWLFFCIADVVWICYALRRKMPALVGMYSAYLLIELSIVVGVLLYS